jgi:hypothetical protein
MSERTAALLEEIRRDFSVDENGVHHVLLTSNEEKEAFNAAILKKMLSINATTFTEEEKPIVGEIMKFLYTIYDDTIPDHSYSRLSGLAKAFHDKNGIPVMSDDTEKFGPRYVEQRIETQTDPNDHQIWIDAFKRRIVRESVQPGTRTYKRWGGKKRTRKHKTRVKKTRRVMRRRETRD